MKFFVIQIAIGSAVAARKSTVPGIESSMPSATNSAYTGTIIAVMGRQLPKRMTYRNERLNRIAYRRERVGGQRRARATVSSGRAAGDQQGVPQRPQRQLRGEDVREVLQRAARWAARR